LDRQQERTDGESLHRCTQYDGATINYNDTGDDYVHTHCYVDYAGDQYHDTLHYHDAYGFDDHYPSDHGDDDPNVRAVRRARTVRYHGSIEIYRNEYDELAYRPIVKDSDEEVVSVAWSYVHGERRWYEYYEGDEPGLYKNQQRALRKAQRKARRMNRNEWRRTA
jgi:hypothetical protein